MKRVTVIGGGNGGLAAAADLALRGFDVTLWRRDRRALARLAAQGLELVLPGGERCVAPVKFSADLDVAVAEGELLVVALPVTGALSVVSDLRQSARRGQTVLLLSGNMAGVPLAKEGFSVIETATLPYGARTAGSSSVRIAMRARRIPAGSHGSLHESHWERVSAAFPEIVRLEDAMDAFLHNINIVVHPPRLLCALSSTQGIHAGSPLAANRMSMCLDDERIALRERLGYWRSHFPIAALVRGDKDAEGIFAVEDLVHLSGLDHHEAIGRDHRYVSEDIEHGLALWLEMARHVGQTMPVAAAIATLIGAAFALPPSRPLEALGLGSVGALLPGGTSI